MASAIGRKEELAKMEVQMSACDIVRFTFPDMHGIARCKLVPGHSVKHTLHAGLPVYLGTLVFGPRNEVTMPQIAPVEAAGNGNGTALPEPNTFSLVPWACNGDGKSKVKAKVGDVICETHWQDGSYQRANPRYVAREQVDKLSQMGWILKGGYECEFTMFHEGTTKPVFEGDDFTMSLTTTEFEEFYVDLDRYLRTAGIWGECFEAEYGWGQFEVPLNPADGIKSADDMLTFKIAVKEIARKYGWHATFMSRPMAHSGGLGTHFNHSLWTADGKNVMYDPDSKVSKLSKIGEHWLAGIIKHIPAISALTNPTVNCYRRLHGMWAPDIGNWAVDDRMMSIRVKSSSPSATYVENRVPSGAANPYISMAATVAAGIDGVVNKFPLPKQRDPDAAKLPVKLSEALDVIKADKVLCKALGEEFIEWFCYAKSNHEVELLEKKGSTIEQELLEYMKFI